MATNMGDWVQKVKKFRSVSAIQHPNFPPSTVSDLLEKISKFLQDHETPSQNDCTHTVFDNYPDWWESSKSQHKLAIAEDNTLDLLYRYISNCYDLGIPLLLTEKRTPQIRFVQDVEIWGNPEACVTVAELMSPSSKFARLLGSTMGEMFPQEEFLDVAVFDASGKSKIKGVMKTSIRLAWSKLVVDKERATRIRDYVVHKFKDCNDEEIKALEGRIRDQNPDLSKDNQWVNIFSDAIYFGRYGIRMPLNDRVSPQPLQHPENRPFSPFAVLRFNFLDGRLLEVEEICGNGVLEGSEWLKIGCVRRPAGEDLTPWTPPVWRGERAPRTVDTQCTTPLGAPAGNGGVSGGGGGGGGLAGRTPGQVKMRTRGGSEPTQRARPRDPQRMQEEKMVTYERAFQGTVSEFCERLETQLGKTDDIVQEEGKLTWSIMGQTGAQVVFKESNHMVYIQGKNHQIRSLLNVISPFVQQVDAARSVVSSRVRSQGGSEAGGSYGPSYAPSAVFKPPAAYAASTASLRSVREGGGMAPERLQRMVCRDFQPEGAGELSLTVGAQVTVTHDPDEGQQNNVHRWVYGTNEATQQKGWFPLSYTNQLETEHAEVQN